MVPKRSAVLRAATANLSQRQRRNVGDRVGKAAIPQQSENFGTAPPVPVEFVNFDVDGANRVECRRTVGEDDTLSAFDVEFQ